ncbi:MAG: DUF3883 domain-containing protein [Anaerolineae bacterium]
MVHDDVVARLKQNAIVRGPLFPEPVQIIITSPLGASVRLVGKGLHSQQVYEHVLSPEQLATLVVSPDREPFDGDAKRFRLGIEALRLGLAYEYDPYFSLSIARVDPLPHQLEAVYDYFLKMPRIRFLLADDPGAGKTIMAGLLIKELKIRGLIQRILIVTPANLSFQWQRELKDKFQENFDVIRGEVLYSVYGSSPWQDHHQAITSISWVSRIDEARDSLLRSHWDLIIVDEAHKMAAYSAEHKTLAYQLGEALSERTDHYLLMTATPHKGDPENFTLFLSLLDRDVYGDLASLQDAMQRQEAPFYLRRVKEALVTFPDPETGQVKALFTKRNVQTLEFELDADEWDFYNALTNYVVEQSTKAAGDKSARGRAIGFTMAMLQRRFASSVYACRRTLERMREKRQRILDDPQAYYQAQIQRRIPDDFDELPEDEQQEILSEAEGAVASPDPAALRAEIGTLDRLIAQAKVVEQSETESKVDALKRLLEEQGVFSDPKMKALIFTEHKDTLDYLVGKLKEWGRSVTQIHGGMKIGDRDTPGTRICAEKEFRESCQFMVATEAAGEGINLQFCWFMINYDIPWNPVRLEQRMGRIHRYLQEHDCLIFNFVSSSTREGRVLQKLFERLREIENALDPERTGKVFNVLGDIFPANELERMLREMYAQNLTENSIVSRIVAEVDTERFRRVTNSTLEGLAKRQLNLAAIVGKSAEAKERRLVPEVIEDFFVQSAPLHGFTPRPVRDGARVYRIGRLPRPLWVVGEGLEPRFGRLGRDYKTVTFDKASLAGDATLEWVTPGHPLFETVRQATSDLAEDDLRRGAVFYDLNRATPARLDVYTAAIKDGRGNVLHRRLFVAETDADGHISIRQPTLFLDITPALSADRQAASADRQAPAGVQPPDDGALPARDQVEQALLKEALEPFLAEVAAQRAHEADVIEHHTRLSLDALINRQNIQLAGLWQQRELGDTSSPVAANLQLVEDRLDELNNRLDRRVAELAQERQCAISDMQLVGRAWVLPHPERNAPGMAAMVRDEEIERIALEAVMAYERAQGREPVSVERDNRGFDLISRRPPAAAGPHPEDLPLSADRQAQTAIEVRFIEVKGRAGVGDVALSANEYKTAERLTQDYWLYVVYNCASTPQVHVVQDPVRLDWRPVRIVEYYRAESSVILTEIPKGEA